MSELTTCNYCKLLSIIAHYGRANVRILPAHANALGGHEVQVREKGQWSPESEPAAWFMELTDHCVC